MWYGRETVADYTEDRASALADLLEDGSQVVMDWTEYTRNDDTGVATVAGTYSAYIAIVTLPVPTRGRSSKDALNVGSKMTFIAAPLDPLVPMLSGYKVTIGGIRYELDTCEPLRPDGTMTILYEGTLRLSS